MSLKLSNDELTIISDLYNLVGIKFSDARFNDIDSRKAVLDSLKPALIAYALGKSIDSPEDVAYVNEVIEKKSDVSVLKFVDGYSVAILTGYLQSLNNDIDSDSTPDFGFKELNEIFQSSILMCMSDFVNADNVSSLIETGLGVVIRDCTPAEYFENEYYHEDLRVLKQILIADIDDGYNKRMKDAISNNGDWRTSMDTYMEDLKAVYTLAFEDGFGTKPYVGVLNSSSGFITVDENASTSHTIKNGEATLSKFATRLCNKMSGSVEISQCRQFDYDEIFSKDNPVYFPKKILEYTLGRESTLNTRRDIYKSSAFSISWESYSANYVYPNLKEILLRGIYKALEKVLMSKGVISTNFTSREFMSVTPDYEAFVANQLKDNDVSNSVFKYVSKLVASMKCFYILTKYPYLANKIAAINIRLSCASNSNAFSVDKSCTSQLFSGLIATNNYEEFLPPVNISGGRTSATNVKISVDIYEYQYDINPMLTQAEPLFGYVVQKQNQRKGKVANWNNILIGEGTSGKELYASKSSDIRLQNSFTHNIIAGSRSGKGVMTMNILASALASGKPIFYLDRKPDMASMLYDLSGGSQFIVNGGLYNADNDTFKHFDESTGDAMEAWRNSISYLEENPRILELFDVSTTSYQGVLGDYVYFRAFMFALGICVLRSKLAGKFDGIRDDIFNGNDGIVIVVDELTGFQNSISRLLSTISSPLVQKALNMGDADVVLNKKADIMAKINVAQMKANEATKESAKMAQEAEIQKLQRQLDSLVDEQCLYAGTLFNKIRSSFATLTSQKVAGFKNKEYNYSDIFVLGQFLDANYYASSLTAKNKGALSSVFFPLTSDKSDYYAAYKGADIVRSFLEELGELDWFLGRNPDYNYGGKNEDAEAKKVTDIDGNWDYVGVHTCNEIRGVDSSTFHHVLFKPYLVLNTHYENDPPTEMSKNPNYQYVTQCANRVNTTAGGDDLWSTVRLKHLREDAKSQVTPDNPMYDCLEEGIGFKGLVRETLLTTKEGKEAAQGNMDDYIKEVLGKSGKIADYVASKMGDYSCWQELIYDLSPQGLFSFDDMITAVMDADKYTMESRLPLYAKLGLLGDMANNDSGLNSSEFGNLDDMYGDEEEFGSEGVESNDSENTWGSTRESNFDDEGFASTSTENDLDEFYKSAEEEMNVIQPSPQEVQNTKPVFTDKDRENYAYPIVTILLDQLSQFTGKNLKPLAPQMIENAKALLKNLGY